MHLKAIPYGISAESLILLYCGKFLVLRPSKHSNPARDRRRHQLFQSAYAAGVSGVGDHRGATSAGCVSFACIPG